jgi:hypothetical protein
MGRAHQFQLGIGIHVVHLQARSHTGDNIAEVRASFKKRQAAKNLAKGDPMAEEMKKLEISKQEASDSYCCTRMISRRSIPPFLRWCAGAPALGSLRQDTSSLATYMPRVFFAHDLRW